MRHRTPRARGQPLRAVCPRNVVRLFRPKGRNWMPRINSGHPTVRLPQTEARDAQRGGPPLESPCRVLSLVLSFASKESTAPSGRQPHRPRRRQSLIGERGIAPAGAPKGFPRGKQSARFALPCAPLVVCLNSGSLTAFGGCIHWIPASLRSPLETFGHRRWRENPWTATPPSAPKSARQTPARGRFEASFFRGQ